MVKLFKDVKCGEAFCYEGEIYMKLLPLEGDFTARGAACLKDGDFVIFCGAETVEIVQIEITAKIEFKVR